MRAAGVHTGACALYRGVFMLQASFTRTMLTYRPISVNPLRCDAPSSAATSVVKSAASAIPDENAVTSSELAKWKKTFDQFATADTIAGTTYDPSGLLAPRRIAADPVCLFPAT